LIDTPARVGAVAKLTLKSLQHDGTQYALRVSEKGGKSREIPVQHDLELNLRGYIAAARIPVGAPVPKVRPPDQAIDHQGDERDRHLPDDVAAAQGGGAARPLLAALLTGHDGDRSSRAERAARGRAVSGWARRPANDAGL